MKSNRRNFLKLSGLAGIGLAGNLKAEADGLKDPTLTKGSQSQRFNMCGYAAPALETVRIGFIGLGNRGPGAVQRINKIEGVDIKGLCDIRPEKANAAKKTVRKHVPSSGSLHRKRERVEKNVRA